MGKQLNVIVTGARSPAALDIARDFAATGYAVHMADSRPAMISRLSKAPTRVHRVRPPVQDPRGFRFDMIDLIRDLKPVMVVPTCEEVFHLSAVLAEGYHVGPLFAPDPETLDMLHAKDRFNTFVRGLGLDAPASRLLDGPFDVDTLDLPNIVLKACYSRFGVGTLVAPTSAQASCVNPTAKRPWIAQDLIKGVEHSSYAIAHKGRITGFSAYRSMHRLSGGAGYAFEAAGPGVWMRMLDASSRIAAATRMTGQISLDAIDDGMRSWLIECNPRATSGVHLLAGHGRIASAMEGMPDVQRHTDGPRHNLPMMLARCSLRGLGEGRDVIGAKGDRWPALGAVADTALYALQALRRRTTLTGATTHDIEWNGSR